MAELESRARSGDAAAAADLLEMRVDLAHLDPEEAWSRLEQLDGVPVERLEALSKKIVAAQVGAIQVTASNDPATQIAAGEKFARMVAAGRIPDDEDALFFWYFTAVYAESERDADLYARALEGLKKHERRLGAEQLQEMQRTLDRLRGGGRNGTA